VVVGVVEGLKTTSCTSAELKTLQWFPSVSERLRLIPEVCSQRESLSRLVDGSTQGLGAGAGNSAFS